MSKFIKPRYEYYKGTTNIVDNEVDEIVEDVVERLNFHDGATKELLEIKRKQAQKMVNLKNQLMNAIILPKGLDVGSKVYLVNEDCDNNTHHILCGKVYWIMKELDYEEDGTTIWIYVRYECGLTYQHTLEDYGVELFATKEEAEQSLKEIKDE